MLLLKKKPFPYSIVSNSKVELYSISKEDLLSKVPKDILETLCINVEKKLNFVQNRIISICKNIE